MAAARCLQCQYRRDVYHRQHVLAGYLDAEADGKLKDMTLTTNQQVSGVGDQAWFIAASVTATGITAHTYSLYVVDGTVAFAIVNFTANGVAALGSASDSTIESKFEQIAHMVISAL